MEVNLGKVCLSHLKNIVTVGEEDVTSFAVDGHELMLALFKCSESICIVTFYPACLVERYGFPPHSSSIFMKQSVLDYLELKLAYRTDNLTAVELVGKQLCNTFVHELLYTLVKLLGFHRVGVFDILEHLRRETWQSLVVQALAFSQRVADFKVAGIRYADDIAWVGFVDDILLLGHERRRSRKTHHFP